MKISMMTLGCPDWDLDMICAKGREYGFDGVDFRGYRDTMDVTTLPEFTTGAGETRQKLADAGLTVSGISSSIMVCVPERRVENLEEARRTIAVAKGFGCTNVRVFGGGDLDVYGRTQLADFGRDCVEAILELDGAQDLHWLFETHDNWIRSSHCKLLLDRIDNPAFGALWDMGHTARVGEESPQETFALIGERIKYTHVKDAVYDPKHAQSMDDGWHYVLPGVGQLPLTEAIGVLRSNGYDDWILFEHEKRWHPELAEPEVAFPAFVQWVRPLIGE
jgi:sugar phosphate isomerase/epimerase